MFAPWMTFRVMVYGVVVVLIMSAYLLGHERGAAGAKFRDERAARVTEQRVSKEEIQGVTELEKAKARISELELQLARRAAVDPSAGNAAIDADSVSRINSVGPSQN